MRRTAQFLFLVLVSVAVCSARHRGRFAPPGFGGGGHGFSGYVGVGGGHGLGFAWRNHPNFGFAWQGAYGSYGGGGYGWGSYGTGAYGPYLGYSPLLYSAPVYSSPIYTAPHPYYPQQPNVTIISVPAVEPPRVDPIVINYNPPQVTAVTPAAAAPGSSQYLIALKDQSIHLSVAYWIEDDTLHYITRGKHEHRRARLDEVDEALTVRLNRERGVEIRLSNR